VADVLARLEQMPYWPQLPQRDPTEDMAPQYVSALEPLVSGVPGSRQVRAFGELSREEALAAFYERLMGGPVESFAPEAARAAGWPVFIDAVGAAEASAFPWLKGHVTGPITMCLSVAGPDGKALLYDDEAAEAIARGLGAAAGAQAAALAGLGRRAMIFLDEPALSGFGSAFTPVSRETVLALLAACLEEARARAELTVGVHCCGNTDWSLLVESGAEVINLDSAGYGDHLLLYPEAVDALLARGGAVAWGAVPTLEYKGNETAEGLWAGLKELLEGLEAKGLDRQRLASQALVTPACGMGSLKVEQSLAILELTAAVSRLAREQYA
jgi:methionine synthase II (cobalamin-independent)